MAEKVLAWIQPVEGLPPGIWPRPPAGGSGGAPEHPIKLPPLPPGTTPEQTAASASATTAMIIKTIPKNFIYASVR